MKFSVTDLEKAFLALSEYADRDLLALEGAEMVRLQRIAATFKNLAEVPFAVIASAIDAQPSTLGRGQGHQSNTHMTAQYAGSGLGRAKDSVEAGGLLGWGGGRPDDAAVTGGGTPPAAPAPPHYPLVAEAFRTGRISIEQAALLKRTLGLLGDDAREAEQSLVDKALRLSLWDLRRACRAMLDRRAPAAVAEREQRQYEARTVRVSEDAEGMVTITAHLDPASAAPVRAWLDAQISEAFRRRRRRRQDPATADHRPRWQIMADAFVMLFSHGLTCEEPSSGVKTQVVVRLSDQGLRDALALGDCDQISGPVTAGTLRRMAVDAGVLPVVLGSQSEVLDLGRSKRLFSRAQRTALVERDGGCAFCHAPAAWCSAHHIKWWRKDRGRSDLSNGVLLCTSCHHRIHDDGWEIRVDGPRVWFIPPAAVDPERRPRLGGKAALEIPDRRVG